ncbi:hypothetical protein [Microvirga rosea]|uniref:hypothetical protein n=1 Tax=Microvirga rosea TaxID=2715425 RepID=UPI001D0BCF4C|nr:hypothetical protein [Microvirga rosea]MCB8823184.1 hypothetical protein [Microvirga rosea]
MAELGADRPVRIRFGTDRWFRVHRRFVELYDGFQERPEANFGREHFSSFIEGFCSLLDGQLSEVVLAHQSGHFELRASMVADDTVEIRILAGQSHELIHLGISEAKQIADEYRSAAT